MSIHLIQADATRLPLADRSVALTFASSPYCDARTYGIGAQRKCVEWVEWMLTVVAECQRVTVGPVLMVAAGVTRDRNYWPACEGLMWEWWKRGGESQLYRPCYWHRVGIPGSGGKDWLRADVEYVMCFKRPGPLAWADNTACGHPPKWGPGGAMSHRLTTGARVNQWGKLGSGKGMGARKPDGSYQSYERPSHQVSVGPFGNQQSSCGRRPDGSKKRPYFNGKGRIVMTRVHDGMHNQDSTYSEPTLANPGNLVKVIVGGGVMGSKLAHENEAPFPEALAEFFIKSFCPPGGTVLDPFSGSGTTVAVAERLGRHGIGSDLRMSQCELSRRRVTESRMVALTGKPKKVRRAAVPKGEAMLFGAA